MCFVVFCRSFLCDLLWLVVSVRGVFVWGGGAHYPGDFDVLVHPS